MKLQVNQQCLLIPPVHKVSGAVNESCPQERIWGSHCRRKFQTQPMFKKPIATGKFSWHPLKKSIKGENKFPPCNRIRFWTSLIITGGCKLKWQWQIKSHRSEWPFSHVTGNNARASQEEREATYTVRGNGHWQQPLESTASLCRLRGGHFPES